MAVPKKRNSSTRTRTRRSHLFRLYKDKAQLAICSNCGSKKLPHFICSKCKFYKHTTYNIKISGDKKSSKTTD